MYAIIREFSVKRLLFLTLVIFVAFSALPYQAGSVSAADKDIQLKRVAQEFLLVGRAQYKKGMYDAALVSLEKANEYRQYLSGSQQSELDELLSKVRTQTYGTKQFQIKINEADRYIAAGQLQKAMAILRDLESYENLTDAMKKSVASKIDDVNMRLMDQRQRLNDVYRKSVSLYNQGDLVQARTGFEEIALTGVAVGNPGMTASDYITKIDDQLAAQRDAKKQQSMDVEDQLMDYQPAQSPVAPEPMVETRPAMPQPQPQPMTTTQPVQAQNTEDITTGYIEVVNKQRQIQQSYTKAVVDDALAAAEQFRINNEFEKAQAKLVQAQAIVNRNRLALGDELFAQYSTRLELMDKQITQQQQAHQQKVQQEKLVQGQATAEKFRLQQEAERQKRIAELLENARNFQRQQRYEEALKQIELLLAIDPQNDIALTSKMLLEDTINFRKQIAIRDEIREEEVGTYRNLMESTIPYDDDIVYSKNWREISARRDSKTTAGMTEEDIKVYEQLSKVVDLSALTPETQLSEAFDILRNSVSPPLSIVVKWNDLADNAFIEQVTPINMEGLPAVSLRKGLELLLESVSGGLAELAYNVEEGVIVVGTRSQLKVQMVTEVYDITDQLLPKVNVSYDLGNISDLGQSEESRGGGGGGGGNQSEIEDEGDDETNREENVQEIITTITETIEPDSWYENGGQGTIRVYQDTQLIVMQTPQIQQQVKRLLDDLQKRFGMQVAIEARFLSVSEDFLENINLDMDIIYDFGGDLGTVDFFQNNLGGQGGNAAGLISGVYDSGTPGLLDDLQVSFLLDATQANSNQRTLNAPKLTVMNGESATIYITQQQNYVGDYEFESISQGDNSNVTVIADPTIYTIADGVALNITPTISADRKYVLLNIGSSLSNVDLSSSALIPSTVEGGTEAPITLPLLDTTTVRTRVNVPDQGTLLIGGLKLNEETENEKGVPVLSKIPYFGRLFKNRNEVRNQRVLLILVKPTIIIKQEAEEQAMTTLAQ